MATLGLVLSVVMIILSVLLCIIILLPNVLLVWAQLAAAAAATHTGAKIKAVPWKALWKDTQKSAALCS